MNVAAMALKMPKMLHSMRIGELMSIALWMLIMWSAVGPCIGYSLGTYAVQK